MPHHLISFGKCKKNHKHLFFLDVIYTHKFNLSFPLPNVFQSRICSVCFFVFVVRFLLVESVWTFRGVFLLEIFSWHSFSPDCTWYTEMFWTRHYERSEALPRCTLSFLCSSLWNDWLKTQLFVCCRAIVLTLVVNG